MLIERIIGVAMGVTAVERGAIIRIERKSQLILINAFRQIRIGDEVAPKSDKVGVA